jgi:hypothetical protein
MNAHIVGQMAVATLSGHLPFPEIVVQLIPEGVEYYRADCVAKELIFYSAESAVVVAPLTYEGLPQLRPSSMGLPHPNLATRMNHPA